MDNTSPVASGTTVIYNGGVSHLVGLTMTVRYQNACGSCRHGGTYVLAYVDPDTGVRKQLERVLRASFAIHEAPNLPEGTDTHWSDGTPLPLEPESD